MRERAPERKKKKQERMYDCVRERVNERTEEEGELVTAYFIIV